MRHNEMFDTENPKYDFQLYLEYPLVHSMLCNESIRNIYFEKATKMQREYPRATDGWAKSIFMMKGRALDRCLFPWLIVSLNACMWTLILQKYINVISMKNVAIWEIMFSSVVNSIISFLLVFRLHRVAMRFWEARGMWGKILVTSRCLVQSILVHTNHAPEARDKAIAYVAAFAISTKHYIRGQQEIPDDELAGILTHNEIHRLEISPHSALFSSNKIREYLKKAFLITSTTPVQNAAAWSIQLNLMEENINILIDQLGGMEKIRSTPLPFVYVSQLRTCLLIYLLSLPFLWINHWGWMTAFVMCVTAFAFLGMEAAASECEIPFNENRTNHLELDAYCYNVIKSIQQLIKDNADFHIQQICGNAGENDNYPGIHCGFEPQKVYRESWNGFNHQVSILVDEYPPLPIPKEIINRKKSFSLDHAPHKRILRRKKQFISEH